MDTVRAADAHGIHVPPEFHDPNVVQALVSLDQLLY